MKAKACQKETITQLRKKSIVCIGLSLIRFVILVSDCNRKSSKEAISESEEKKKEEKKQRMQLGHSAHDFAEHLMPIQKKENMTQQATLAFKSNSVSCR